MEVRATCQSTLPDYDLIRVEDPPAPQVDQIFAAIRAYNEPLVGAWHPLRIAFFARDATICFLAVSMALLREAGFS